MAGEDRHEQAAGEPEGSVLGSLPRERPGTRSRLRQRAAPRAGEPGPEAEPSGGGEPGGRRLEDLAWAGIAVAAEAATLGVRLANRALEAGSSARRRS